VTVEPETLRVALDRITKIHIQTVFQYGFDKLQEQYRHTIRIIPADREWLNTFNCYAFALGIVDRERYKILFEMHDKKIALANSRFISLLLAQGELVETGPQKPEIDNLVLYFRGSHVTHAGVVITDDPAMIRSKWGAGELYEHGLWEVPCSYGDGVKFIRAPLPERIMELLEGHLRIEVGNDERPRRTTK
jgi:hypothetical protein